MRRGCGRRDERAGDAISNRHQAIQHRSSKLGSSRCRGRLRALRENVWLCLSSRAPSGAGRSPYHSEPSIEAPNSSTLSRRLKQKPPQTHDIQPHPARRRYLPDSVTDVSDVGRVDTKLTLERRKASPRSDTPRQPRTLGLTLVTVLERGQLRVRSVVFPAIKRFLSAPGFGARLHLTRSWHFRGQLRVRSEKPCKIASFSCVGVMS